MDSMWRIPVIPATAGIVILTGALTVDTATLQSDVQQVAAVSSTDPSVYLTAEPLRPRAKVSRVTKRDLGNSLKPGCPVRPSQLRAIDINHWDYDGNIQRGRIIVNQKVVGTVRLALQKAFKHRFRIHSMIPVQAFDSSDDKSMAADNTSGFNCRRFPGSSSWSRHAYADAIDINPRRNPHVFPHQTLPPNGKTYIDRSDRRIGMLYRNSVITKIFRSKGWTWGGSYRNPDYQHFSLTGR